MKLLVGVHMKKGHKSQRFAEFVKKHFESEPNTLFVAFNWPTFSKQDMLDLAKKSGVAEKNFIFVTTDFRKSPGSAFFKPYERNFKSVVKHISLRMGSKENLEVIGFGGAAEHCYERIFGRVTEILGKKFKGRLKQSRSVMPWIYGKSGTILRNKRNKLRKSIFTTTSVRHRKP